MPAGESLPADAPPAPQAGDVLVTRESQSRVHYTVRQIPGVVQFSAGRLEDALRLAQGFARTYAVDVWYREDDRADELLDSHRARPAQQARHAAEVNESRPS